MTKDSIDWTHPHDEYSQLAPNLRICLRMLCSYFAYIELVNQSGAAGPVPDNIRLQNTSKNVNINMGDPTELGAQAQEGLDHRGCRWHQSGTVQPGEQFWCQNSSFAP